MYKSKILRGLTALSAMLSIPQISNCIENKIERPNIFLIMADDLGAEALGCYGGSGVSF
jgi:hypothetical protein